MKADVESETAGAAASATQKVKMSGRGVDVFYGEKQAIFNIDLDIHENEVTALIGPSGCGKSTYLRCLNRMNDTIDIWDISRKTSGPGQPAPMRYGNLKISSALS